MKMKKLALFVASLSVVAMTFLPVSVEGKVSSDLSNKNATPEAKALMKFMTDIYGKYMISGQQQESWVSGMPRIEWLKNKTGKKPGLVGFDFMDYTPVRVKDNRKCSDVDKAIEWHKQGGIVTFVWHWNSPRTSASIDKGFYSDGNQINISDALSKKNGDYDLILKDIDAIAEQIKRLQDANVPVLWRPLHEADGKWFWWGMQGSDSCKKLYDLLYDRLTNHHKLNNLVWVWSYAHTLNGKDWCPDQSKVDVAALDCYYGKYSYGTNKDKFDKLMSFTGGNKMGGISENDSIPDPDKLVSEKVPWLYFCTWNDFETGAYVSNSEDHLKKVFNHNYVLTLDELKGAGYDTSGMSSSPTPTTPPTVAPTNIPTKAPTLAPTQTPTSTPMPKDTPTNTPKIDPTPTEEALQLGDLDSDGKVSSSDVALCKRFVLEIITELPKEANKKVADLNEDGKVDSRDYVLLKQYIVGVITTLPKAN
jgi:mannan endo-1,4-beta-mannosidase